MKKIKLLITTALIGILAISANSVNAYESSGTIETELPWITSADEGYSSQSYSATSYSSTAELSEDDVFLNEPCVYSPDENATLNYNIDSSNFCTKLNNYVKGLTCRKTNFYNNVNSEDPVIYSYDYELKYNRYSTNLHLVVLATGNNYSNSSYIYTNDQLVGIGFYNEAGPEDFLYGTYTCSDNSYDLVDSKIYYFFKDVNNLYKTNEDETTTNFNIEAGWNSYDFKKIEEMNIKFNSEHWKYIYEQENDYFKKFISCFITPRLLDGMKLNVNQKNIKQAIIDFENGRIPTDILTYDTREENVKQIVKRYFFDSTKYVSIINFLNEETDEIIGYGITPLNDIRGEINLYDGSVGTYYFGLENKIKCFDTTAGQTVDYFVENGWSLKKKAGIVSTEEHVTNINATLINTEQELSDYCNYDLPTRVLIENTLFKDEVAPTLKSTSFETTVNCKFNIQNLNNYFNEDSMFFIDIIEDNYSSNWNKRGNYTIKLKAFDYIGNENEVTINFNVSEYFKEVSLFDYLTEYSSGNSSYPYLIAHQSEYINIGFDFNKMLDFIEEAGSENVIIFSLYKYGGNYSVTFQNGNFQGNGPISIGDLTHYFFAKENESFTLYGNTYKADSTNMYQVDASNKTINPVSICKFHHGDFSEISIPDNELTNKLLKEVLYVAIEAGEIGPEITCSDFEIDIDNPISLKAILPSLNAKAIDNLDGDISKKIYIKESDYPTDLADLALGEYYITLAVEDSDGNETTKRIAVRVVDKTAPIITGATTFTVSNKSLLNVEVIKNSLEVTDNIDEEVQVALISDYYTEHYQTPGVYLVTFEATDSSGNRTKYIVEVTVRDGEAPQFHDSEGKVVTETIINKSTDSVLIIGDIINRLTITDNITENIKAEITSDTFTGHGDEKGTYKVVLKAEDEAGNITTHNIIINVTESMPSKTYVIDKKFIVVEADNILVNEEIVAILKTCGYYSEATTTYIDIDASSYTDSANIVGNYLIGVSMRTTAGDSSELTLSIEVVEPISSDTTIKKEAKNGLLAVLESIWNFIAKICKSFWNFITSLGKKN